MRIGAAVTCAAVLAATPVCAWQVKLLEQPFYVESVEYPDEVLLRDGTNLWRLRLENGLIKLSRVETEPNKKLEPDALPDTKVVSSQALGGILYLAQPTTRYAHGVLGDSVEAAALVLLRSDGSKTSLPAGADAVFEDLTPRLYDLDRDGIPKIVVVKSYLDRGASLAVIGLDKGKLKVVAETPAIGTPHRWLNPAGSGNFSGSSRMEIAFVRMPHALGRLEIWQWANGKLKNVATVSDTSNHVIGSRSLNMAVVADFDGDGAADIAIPSFDRRSIRILKFHGGTKEIARVRLPARAARGIGLLQEGNRRVILVGLEDGRVALLVE